MDTNPYTPPQMPPAVNAVARAARWRGVQRLASALSAILLGACAGGVILLILLQLKGHTTDLDVRIHFLVSTLLLPVLVAGALLLALVFAISVALKGRDVKGMLVELIERKKPRG